MRITTSYIYSSALRGLKRNQGLLDRAQSELTSGRKVITASDNPTDAAIATRLASNVADLDQYQRNGRMASTRLETAGAALSAVVDLLNEAQEVAKGASRLPPNDPGREAASATIAVIRQQVISIGNTKIGDEYIFAGIASGTPPFDQNGQYLGSANSRRVEVDEGVYLETNDPGGPIFSGLIESLDGIKQVITSGDEGSITRAAGGLEVAARTLQAAITDNGLRQTRIETIGTTLAERAAGLSEKRDALLNADPTEATLGAVEAQTALERAYAAVSRVLQTNILNYLR